MHHGPAGQRARLHGVKEGDRKLPMKIKDIQEMRDVAPFKPFSLHLSSGRTIKISTPDHLLFSPRGDLLVVFPSTGGVFVVEPAHVASLDLPRAA